MDTRFRVNASARGGRRRLFFVTLLILFIVFLDFLSGGKIRAAVREIVTPLSETGLRAWTGLTQSGYFSSRRALEAQIADLESQLQTAQQTNAAFSVIQQQNVALAQITHLAQTTPGMTAPIISSLTSSPYGTFLIGAGSAEGVSRGLLVLSGDGFLVGTVGDVQTHSALINEIFAPGASSNVVIDGASVSLSGQGGAQGHANVPHGITVSVGDPVMAPQMKDHAVGVVAHVTSDPSSAATQVYVSLPFNLSSLQFVYITP